MSLSINQLAKPLKVTRRIVETDEAVSLVLEVPEELKAQFHYQAGQFVTFFLTIDGETLSRSYSLSSSPIVDMEFQITVKRVPGGRGSNFLCGNVQVGDALMTTPPSGAFFKPALEPKGIHYMLFAAGSGITPVYSILKTVLTASPVSHVTLVYCNRNQKGIIYRNEIETLAKAHPTRLNVVRILSKPDGNWPGLGGRIDRTFIHEVLEMGRSAGPTQSEYYLCGPVEFMHLVHNTLNESGVPKDLIHQESFGLTVHKPHAINKDWTLIGPNPEQAEEGPEKIVALINGETVEVAAKPGVSILETLLEAGAQPPYSCMDGACMACLGKVQQGRVYQEDPGILADENIANCETLTCQAKPLSKLVKISYDNL